MSIKNVSANEVKTNTNGNTEKPKNSEVKKEKENETIIPNKTNTEEKTNFSKKDLTTKSAKEIIEELELATNGNDKKTEDKFGILKGINEAIKNLGSKFENTKIENKNDTDVTELKSKVLNEDGTINPDNIVEYFESDNFSIYDLEKALGGNVKETLSMNDNFGTYYTRKIELPNGEFINYYVEGKEGEEVEYIEMGKATEEANGGTRYKYYDQYGETDNRFDLTQTEIYKKEIENKAAEEERISNLTNQITNEDGNLNYDKIGELISSGEMSVPDFLATNGYDLTNHDDQTAIGLTMSSTFSYTMPDGTSVNGCISSWGTQVEHITFTTTDGKKYYFEANS